MHALINSIFRAELAMSDFWQLVTVLSGLGFSVFGIGYAATRQAVAAAMARFDAHIAEEEKRLAVLDRAIRGIMTDREAVERRVTVLETRVPTLPSASSVSDLAVQLERHAGNLKAATVRLDAMAAALDRVLDKLGKFEERGDRS